MTLHCLIVDDEPLAREQIEAYVRQTPFLKLVGSVRNPTQARAIMDREPVDLIFLDIQMPGMSGIDFLRTHPVFQQVIFITAFPEYAVDGFELEVTDYLMKPVNFDRFSKAAQKALVKVSGTDAIKKIVQQPDTFFIKHNQRYEKIHSHDILYIESMLNYVCIVTDKEKYTVYSSLKQIEENLPADKFIRIHKSFIVPLDKITRLEQQHLFMEELQLPISRSRKSKVYEAVLKKREDV